MHLKGADVNERGLFNVSDFIRRRVKQAFLCALQQSELGRPRSQVVAQAGGRTTQPC